MSTRWLRLMSWALLAVGCYSPHPRAGSPCDDDQHCPIGQRCVAGICGGGDAGAVVDSPAVDAEPDAPEIDAAMFECTTTCPNTNPCATVACVDHHCVTTKRADGFSCGVGVASRCCAGTCVDTASDEHNCGGCGLKCATGRTCESVALTTACPVSPAATSGRCTCAGVNSECPGGQICRTVTPANNRCAPQNSLDCAAGESYVEVNSCPNYCRYP